MQDLPNEIVFHILESCEPLDYFHTLEAATGLEWKVDSQYERKRTARQLELKVIERRKMKESIAVSFQSGNLNSIFAEGIPGSPDAPAPLADMLSATFAALSKGDFMDKLMDQLGPMIKGIAATDEEPANVGALMSQFMGQFNPTQFINPEMMAEIGAITAGMQQGIAMQGFNTLMQMPLDDPRLPRPNPMGAFGPSKIPRRKAVPPPPPPPPSDE